MKLSERGTICRIPALALALSLGALAQSPILISQPVNNSVVVTLAGNTRPEAVAANLPAFGTTVGWDFATGIGSVNATNLVVTWKAVVP